MVVLRNEWFVTAYSIQVGRWEEIERYETVAEAFQDMLNLWPEDESGDVGITTVDGKLSIYMKRDAKDSLVVHAYFIGSDESNLGHVESYRCEYVYDVNGVLDTKIERLA